MDAPETRGPRGAPRPRPRGRSNHNPFSRASTRSGAGRFSTEAETTTRGPRRYGINPDMALKEVHRRDPGFPEERLVVQGWKESKAATNPGGGVTELIAWLARKAAGPRAAPIHMRQVSF